MFTIYSKPNCSFCDKAKSLLKIKGLEFKELTLMSGQVVEPGLEYYTLPQLHEKVPGARTVPQIFDNDQLIGGFDALRIHLG